MALDLQTSSPLSRCQGAEGTRERRVLRAQGRRARSHLLVALVAGTARPPLLCAASKHTPACEPPFIFKLIPCVIYRELFLKSLRI